MPWVGTNFIRDDGVTTGPAVWNAQATTTEFILSSTHDYHDQDIATGITACINKNGANTPTANIGWGNFKITALANGSANTDSMAFGQSLGTLTLDGGTFVLTAADKTGTSITTVDLTPLSGGGGGGAPSDATYLTLSTAGGLTNERVLTGTAGQITITDAGAGSTATLTLANTAVTPGTYNLATVTVDAKGRITSAASGSGGTGITTINGTAPIGVSGSGASRTVSISAATTSLPGSLSAADKTKLDSITSGAAVASFNARTGAVVPATSDYTIQQIANVTVSTSAPSGSPANGALWFRVP